MQILTSRGNFYSVIIDLFFLIRFQLKNITSLLYIYIIAYVYNFSSGGGKWGKMGVNELVDEFISLRVKEKIFVGQVYPTYGTTTPGVQLPLSTGEGRISS